MTVPLGPRAAAPATGASSTFADVDEFRAVRAHAWHELAGLVNRRSRRRRAEDALRLSRLQREVVADLAVARRRWPGESVVDALEDLVAAGHLALAAPGRGTPATLRSWLRRGVWDALRDADAECAVAVAVVALSAVAGVLWVGEDAGSAATVVPVSVRRDVAAGIVALPVAPLAVLVAFAAGIAGAVLAWPVLVWVGLASGATIGVALDADAAVRAGAATMAALPLLLLTALAAGIGSRAGRSLLGGDVAAWTERTGRGAQVLATLLPLAGIAAFGREVGRSHPTPAAAGGAALVLALVAGVGYARARALTSR